MTQTSENLARIREIYAALPDIQCKGLCGNECRNILLSPLENDQILAITESRTVRSKQ